MIRQATNEDLESIQGLNKLLFEKEHNDYDSLLDTSWSFGKNGREYFEKVIAGKDNIALVAESDGKIVGYLAGVVRPESIYGNGVLEAEIENTLVLDEYRGRGIGSKLIDSFVDWAKEAGAKRIEVRASSGNEKGIAFYRKNGFEDFDTVLKIDL